MATALFYSWWGCYAGKERQKERLKEFFYICAHFPEHNTPRRRKFRTYKSIRSLPANQTVIKAKTLQYLSLPLRLDGASQRKNQISSSLLHRQIKQSKIKSKGIFFLPWIYSTKIFLLLNNENRYSSSNLRNPKVRASVFPHTSHFLNHEKAVLRNLSKVGCNLWCPKNKGLSKEKKNHKFTMLWMSLPSLVI